LTGEKLEFAAVEPILVARDDLTLPPDSNSKNPVAIKTSTNRMTQCYSSTVEN
jgi:hypothetical protein